MTLEMVMKELVLFPTPAELLWPHPYTVLKIFKCKYDYFAKLKFDISTAWKVSKYGVFSGPYFPVFGLNTDKYRPEKTPYLDSFHVVKLSP